MKMPAGMRGTLGLFGGAFDPVHHGHLRTAYELKERLGLDRVHFLPAAVPPHRDRPVASFEQRVQMLEAALANEADCVVDRREAERTGPSYTIETAESFRREFPDHALCLLLGMDAFIGLPTWRRWRELLDLVNLVVARRPGSALPESGELGSLIAERRVHPADAIARAPAGQIIVQDVTQLEIASSEIRDSIRAGLEPRYLVPESVRRIIESCRCYAQ